MFRLDDANVFRAVSAKVVSWSARSSKSSSKRRRAISSGEGCESESAHCLAIWPDSAASNLVVFSFF